MTATGIEALERRLRAMDPAVETARRLITAPTPEGGPLP